MQSLQSRSTLLKNLLKPNGSEFLKVSDIHNFGKYWCLIGYEE